MARADGGGIMKILVTGSGGFIGKNLVAGLYGKGYRDLLPCKRQTDMERLRAYALECDVVFHLAGVNRPQREEEFETGNTGYTRSLLDCLEKNRKQVHIVYASSVQAETDSPYGKSKHRTEELLKEFAAEKAGISLSVYRLPGVFGKWARPYYNSVTATFCHRAARRQPLEIHDPEAMLTLVYIDDVVDAFLRELEMGAEQSRMESLLKDTGAGGQQTETIYRQILRQYHLTVGELARIIQSFPKRRQTLEVSRPGNTLERRLYSTFTSYLEPDGLNYPLQTHIDERGSFTEFLKMPSGGQVSVSVIKPGITKGGHWHQTKTEKFLVAKGMGLVRFRHRITGQTVEYAVSGEKMEVVDIPAGYIHSITNTGSGELVLVIWADEVFDRKHPDTYAEYTEWESGNIKGSG